MVNSIYLKTYIMINYKIYNRSSCSHVPQGIQLNIGNRDYRISSKYNLTLSREQYALIYGCILGDLHAEKVNINSNTRLQLRLLIYIRLIFIIYTISLKSLQLDLL